VTDCRQDWLKDAADYAAPVEELALWMARLIRFQGRSPVPMSVACHSMVVMKLLPPDRTTAAARLALMHDAHECYASDVPRPVKERLGFELDNITNEIDAILFPRYRVTFTDEDRRLVEAADHMANRIECETLHMASLDQAVFALKQFSSECPALAVEATRGFVAKKLAWAKTVDQDKNGWLWFWEDLKDEQRKASV
jgi:hypothetical protein